MLLLNEQGNYEAMLKNTTKFIHCVATVKSGILALLASCMRGFVACMPRHITSFKKSTETDMAFARYAGRLSVATIAVVLAMQAQAQIKVGVVLSVTGPAASLGIPEKNTISLLPRDIGGKSVEYIVLDDGSDTTAAVKNTRRLTSDKVDVIIGSSTTPNSLAMIDVAAETQTPMIAVAASAKIIEPMDEKRTWVFKTPQNDSLMASALVERMVVDKVKTVAYIGFSDSYGQGWNSEFVKEAGVHKLKITASEGYADSRSAPVSWTRKSANRSTACKAVCRAPPTWTASSRYWKATLKACSAPWTSTSSSVTCASRKWRSA